MRRNIKLIILLSFFPFFAKAQSNEAGIILGISEYQGDLAARGFTLEGTNLAFGLFYQKDFLKNFGLKLNYYQTRLVGNDGFATNNLVEKDKFRRERNLSFYTNLNEIDATIQYQLFSYNQNLRIKLNPYVYAGVGMFKFNPKTEYNGKEYELRNLPTELDKPKYALTQTTIPLGFGVKKLIKKNLLIGVFFQFNFTFTDYIDDVSGKWSDYGLIKEEYGNDIAVLGHRYLEKNPNATIKTNNQKSMVNRGKMSKKDSYYFIGFTIAKRFYIRKTPSTDGLYRKEYKIRSKCPDFFK